MRMARSKAEEKRQLITIAKDFELFDREDVKKIIDSFTDYGQSHRKLMKIYESTYMG